MNETQLALLLFIVVFLPIFYISGRRVQEGNFPDLRPIPAFDALRGVMARAIETGRRVHVGLGIGGISGYMTADSLAGLSVLEYLANQSAATGVPPLVTMADPTLLIAAQDVMRRPYRDDWGEAANAMRHARWIAPEPAAYAAGVLGMLGSEAVDANVLIGAFGDEYLLLGEAANRKKISSVGGASDPNVLPFVFASADYALMGEDMYAAGAYLAQKPWHIGSLLAQDLMRWVIVATIIVLVVIKSLI